MKTKSILITALTLMLATAGCSDNTKVEQGDGLPPVIESIDLSLDMGIEVGFSRSINDDDPSKTQCHERCASSHRLAVTVGNDDSNVAYYTYDDVKGKWVPVGTGVRFPDFNSHDVKMRLCTGISDPVGAQTDGSAVNLLTADVLETTLSAQSPTKELPSASLTHRHSLIDIRLDGSVKAAEVDAVSVNGTLVPYNVKENGLNGSKYLVIVSPGNDDAKIVVKYKGVEYSCEVKASDTQSGEFLAHTRYILPMTIQGGKLVCKGILVKNWNESAGAEVETGSTSFRITGYEDKTLNVMIGTQLFDGILTLDANGEGRLPFLTLDDYGASVVYVQYPGHLQVPVNKALGSRIVLNVDPADGTVIP